METRPFAEDVAETLSAYLTGSIPKDHRSAELERLIRRAIEQRKETKANG